MSDFEIHYPTFMNKFRLEEWSGLTAEQTGLLRDQVTSIKFDYSYDEFWSMRFVKSFELMIEDTLDGKISQAIDAIKPTTHNVKIAIVDGSLKVQSYFNLEDVKVQHVAYELNYSKQEIARYSLTGVATTMNRVTVVEEKGA